MVCVIGLVLAFGSSDNLAAAYGIAVAGTMVITTGLLAIVARRIWRWSLPVTAVVIGFVLLVDVAFFAANAVKIPQGGWFPLLVGVIVFTLMSTWRRGRQIVLERTSEDNPPLAQFIAELDPSKMPRVEGTAVYLAARRETVPYALSDNLRHNKVLHDRVVLLTVVTERIPYVAEAERMTLEPLGKGFTAMALHFGFAEAPAVPAALEMHRAEFTIDLADTSFFVGRETPAPTVRPEFPIWRGREDEGQRLFERLLALRNDVGLLSEEYDVATGRLVGNFPQAFSHVALVNTAHNLARSSKPAEQRAGDAEPGHGGPV